MQIITKQTAHRQHFPTSAYCIISDAKCCVICCDVTLCFALSKIELAAAQLAFWPAKLFQSLLRSLCCSIFRYSKIIIFLHFYIPQTQTSTEGHIYRVIRWVRWVPNSSLGFQDCFQILFQNLKGRADKLSAWLVMNKISLLNIRHLPRISQ